MPVRVGFHKSHSRGVKSAYDLGKMNSSICKRSHKFDGVGGGRTRTFPFSSDSNHDSFAYDLSQIETVGSTSRRINQS